MGTVAPKVFAWKHFLTYLVLVTSCSIIGVYIFFRFFYGLDGVILAVVVFISSQLTFTGKQVKLLWARSTLRNKAAEEAKRDITMRALLSVWFIGIVFLVGLLN